MQLISWIEQIRKSGLQAVGLRVKVIVIWLLAGALAFVGISAWKMLSLAMVMREVESGISESSFLGLHLQTLTVEGNVHTLNPEWGLAILLVICLLGALGTMLTWRHFRRT